MTETEALTSAIYTGWHTFQAVLIEALQPLDLDQLALSAAPGLRTVGEIAQHIKGARARWFYLLMDEGGEEFARLGKWDRRAARQRSAAEIVRGLESTWREMQEAIGRWTPEEWQQTYPGEDDSEPEMITRQWVIWHLIEHDLFHGGEISLTLGIHGLRAVDL
jgi:uncharacterized damage-inducible protein DinB